MEQIKIAVLTTSNTDFEKYRNSQPKEIQETLCKITVLRDIREKQYNKAVLLVESRNITDRVINEVKEMSLFVENLTDKTFYN